ncbi:nuclear transport factor 2 family protein [Pseudomonas sp. v388]|uniref:nuclear transport factor 2 family protein n=1 Tax=Pseudomonas sp. v388 TaxID=2479849 RepID=UPI000F7A9E77|nr:DUF4440 domain-containing protein [Pseudomonas sp. v388]RRV04600.1 nuclear transport factor 2 family protein [Pseudomonas sp. v388]
MTLKENIQELEERLLRREVRSNESVAALLADDFVEFGASGQVWNKSEVIAGLKSEVFVARSISNVQVRTLAECVVLLTYVCHSTTTSLRSSIWRLDGGNWQMTFHQGTRLE